MSIMSIFRRSRPTDAIRALYGAIVRQARTPRLFSDLGVPDTVDGRFEMVALHAFLVMRRLKGASGAAATSQALFDVMFDDMDVSLREMGAGDMGVGKRVKAMVQAFYGRVAAYEAGLAAGEEGLAEALRKNAYGTVTPDEDSVRGLARYTAVQDAHLAAQNPLRIAGGDVSFTEVT